MKALPEEETEAHSDEMKSHTDLTPAQQKAFTEMETNMGTEKPAKATSLKALSQHHVLPLAPAPLVGISEKCIQP